MRQSWAAGRDHSGATPPSAHSDHVTPWQAGLTWLSPRLQVGGRVDYRQKINDVNFVLSGTDASARDYESVPAVKDLVITADTHVNGETACFLN